MGKQIGAPGWSTKIHLEPERVWKGVLEQQKQKTKYIKQQNTNQKTEKQS